MKIYSLVNQLENKTIAFFGTRSEAKLAKKDLADKNVTIAPVEILTRREPLATALNYLVFGRGELPKKPKPSAVA